MINFLMVWLRRFYFAGLNALFFIFFSVFDIFLIAFFFFHIFYSITQLLEDLLLGDLFKKLILFFFFAFYCFLHQIFLCLDQAFHFDHHMVICEVIEDHFEDIDWDEKNLNRMGYYFSR